jgi:hypothetical protein
MPASFVCARFGARSAFVDETPRISSNTASPFEDRGVPTMLPILIACVIWFPALVGLGSPLARSLRRASGAFVCSIAVHATIAGVLGMFVAATIAATTNFFVSVYPWVSSGILILGWSLLIRDRRRWMRLPHKAWRLVGGVLLVVALIDARGVQWYDTALYHIQAVQWLTSSPLPLGLANLYNRLGHNCTWFVFAAATETPLLLGQSCFIANALLAILIALPALDALIRQRRGILRHDRILLILMLVPLAYFGVAVGMISSLAPDPAVAFLILFSAALWVRSARFVPHILLLAFFAMTIKLSAAPLLGIAFLAPIASLVRGRDKIKIPMLATGFCAAAGIIFLIRGIWISGYPVFPSQFGRVSDLSWTVPSADALHTQHDIESWSRYHEVYERVAPRTPWLATWLRTVAISSPMLTVYIIFIVGVCLWCHRRPAFTPALLRCVFAIVALLPAIAFWFVESPLIRFGFGYLFSAAALSLAIGAGGSVIPRVGLQKRRVMLASAIATILFIARIDRNLLKSKLLRWPAIPEVELESHRTLDGLIVRMPRNDDRLWNTPIPATPELNPHLRCERDAEGRIRRFFIE